MPPKNRGLGGGGLAALFGDAALQSDNATDFEYISVSNIEPRRDQPRVTFEREPLEELAASIREHGVVQPLTVRRVNGVYQIIAGERRWRAARMAELDVVPARILDVDDRIATELSLVENLQRENLNPIEEAVGYRVLADDYGLTQEEIAAAMGKSRATIANALRLLNLPDSTMSLVREGKLAAGSARALLAIRDDDTQQRAAREIVELGMSTRDAESYARRLSHGNPPGTNHDDAIRDYLPPINYMAEHEEKLTLALGRKVRIVNSKRGNGGRIEIEYYGDDDFERLFNGLAAIGEDA
ncbi:MAG: ParB/RepB/Spo0J family partition protein [Oscillospiraceae bacterium]|jgi:ParB family chromosome partitioning protein|nr:ParB/RepB/Spo0J family partition protein [Oscillospiraceae bacterium]